jgi:hypothetical protein
MSSDVWQWATESTMEKWGHLKKNGEGFPLFFVIHPSGPGDRETISVVIPFDLLRKKRALIQKANVGQGRQRWTRWWKGEVTQRSSLKIVVSRLNRSWCGVSVDGKKKKVMKKQRRSKDKKIMKKLSFVAKPEFQILWGWTGAPCPNLSLWRTWCVPKFLVFPSPYLRIPNSWCRYAKDDLSTDLCSRCLK